MTEAKFLVTARSRGYAYSYQTREWLRIREHRKQTYTEDDLMALHEWAERQDWDRFLESRKGLPHVTLDGHDNYGEESMP